MTKIRVYDAPKGYAGEWGVWKHTEGDDEPTLVDYFISRRRARQFLKGYSFGMGVNGEEE